MNPQALPPVKKKGIERMGPSSWELPPPDEFQESLNGLRTQIKLRKPIGGCIGRMGGTC